MKRKLLLFTAFILLVSGIFTHSGALVNKGGEETPNDLLVVRNSQGEYVGIITRGLADEAGNVLFAVLSVGGDKEGKKEILVPITALTKDPTGSIILDAEKDVLGSAPQYDFSDFNDPDFAEKVYRHYGKTPPWTENKPDSGKKK